MADLQRFPLTTASGKNGAVFRRARFLDGDESSLVRLDDGREFQVPASALRVQADGSFFLQEDKFQDAERPAQEHQPIQPTESIHSNGPAPAAREVVVDEPLFVDDVGVERVPINRLMDEPAEIRHEGDVMIIPVIEEVIIVQKRYLLKEEVRVVRRRSEFREPRRIAVNDSQTRIIGADGREITP